jgi:hypothetical protein
LHHLIGRNRIPLSRLGNDAHHSIVLYIAGRRGARYSSQRTVVIASSAAGRWQETTDIPTPQGITVFALLLSSAACP